MYERNYLLNPFMLQTSTDEELCREINNLANQYRHSDIIQDTIFNIELESDLLMIYGEMIARIQEEAALTKLDADAIEDKAIYQLRSDWTKANNEKAPAIDYFKAQASEIVKDKRIHQFKKESMLRRFKQAYESLETKQNALKKKVEVIKYEC